MVGEEVVALSPPAQLDNRKRKLDELESEAAPTHDQSASPGNAEESAEQVAAEEVPDASDAKRPRVDDSVPEGFGSENGYQNGKEDAVQENKRLKRAQAEKEAERCRPVRDVAEEKSSRSRHGDNATDSLAKMKAAEEALEAKKQKPSFEYSGKLAEETNRVRGITLLFNEPPDARKPSVRWRLYVFKAGEALNEPLYVHRQSCYLFGRERRVADIPTDHPSCSKQHAVLQFRQVEKEKPDGTMSKQISPYIMDLGSTNKTFINDNPIEPQRYYELFEKDTLRFGNSSREYVLPHKNSLSS